MTIQSDTAALLKSIDTAIAATQATLKSLQSLRDATANNQNFIGSIPPTPAPAPTPAPGA